MSNTVRMNMDVSQEVAVLLEEMAMAEETTKAEIVRRALSIMKAYREQRRAGRSHIGFASDSDSLDAEIVGILEK